MKLTTTSMRVHVAEQLIESVTEPSNSNYYVFTGRPRSWEDDNNPPQPLDSYNDSVFNIYDTMVMGKKITGNDLAHMVKNYGWTINTVFAMYDDNDPELYLKKFFTIVDQSTAYHVYKCLYNNAGGPSTIPPQREDTSEDDIFYFTSDGYQWKYLYSIDKADYNKFSTNDFIPVIPNANVTANAVGGSIDVIVIENPGAQYNSYANGYFQEINVGGDILVHTIDPFSSANTDFYRESAIKIVAGKGVGQQRTVSEYIVSGGFKRVVIDSPFEDSPDNTSRYEITPRVVITGDGSPQAYARALIDPNSNTVSGVEITERGANYTYAVATVTGNTGFISIGNNAPIAANTAVLRPIVSPTYGHGGNLPVELGATAVCFSVTLANTESLTIPASGSFRQIGILKDPLFANVELYLSNTEGTFVTGENVLQEGSSDVGVVTLYSEPSGFVRLTNVTAGFGIGHVVRGASSNATAVVSSIHITGATKQFLTFDQRLRFDTTFNGTDPFTEGEFISQQGTFANAYVHESNTTFTAVTQPRGTFNITDNGSYQLVGNNAVANVNAIYTQDLVKASGQVLYVENNQPVTRNPDLLEQVKFIIRF